MEIAEKYRTQFLEDTLLFRDFLENILEDWDGFLSDKEGMNELFRTAHSLKSGAGFLEMGTLEKQAHELEEAITRKETHELEQRVGQLLSLILEPDMGGVSLSLDQDIENEAYEGQVKKPLGEWDRSLLEDAQFRGEQLYRIECRIDRDEPMKRARAYLVMNQMELHCNVLRTEPDIEDEEASFQFFLLYVTSEYDVAQIQRLLNFDRIEKVDIRPLNYEDMESISRQDDVFFSGLLEDKKNLLTIEKEDLQDLHSLWDELSHSLSSLSSSQGAESRVMKILKEGRKKLDEMSRFDLQDLESELSERVSAYGKKMNKEAEFSIRGNRVRLPREWLSPLLRILQQLVRNSLVHGIESAEERKLSGKESCGQLTLSLNKENDKLIIHYSDDGRGINEELLRQKKDSSTKAGTGKASLLQLITTRGLSSSSEADTYSGRGIGMDLLVQAVEKELHGNLLLQNYPGKGTGFIITIPFQEGKSFLQFRYRGSLYLLSREYVKESITLDAQQIWKKNSGEYYLKKTGFQPIYTVNGSLKNIEDIRGCPFGIQISYLGKTAFIVAEDLMVERKIPGRKEEMLRRASKKGIHDALIPIGNKSYLLLPNLIE